MKFVWILLLVGMLALFFPYEPETDSPSEKRKERFVYMILSSLGLTLGVLHQLGMFPLFADWMDDVMDILFHSVGGMQQ